MQLLRARVPSGTVHSGAQPRERDRGSKKDHPNARIQGIHPRCRRPDANFRFPACKKQEKYGCCKDKRCLFPTTCQNIEADHTDYLELLRELRHIEGVKKVFVRSGLRYDYMMAEKNDAFFRELVEHHISGQLKVAPEHMSDNALYYMGKPSFKVYEQFRERYARINEKLGRKQYLVPI